MTRSSDPARAGAARVGAARAAPVGVAAARAASVGHDPAALGPEGVQVTGIVLAGGRSARFGTNKLAADLGGRPLLHRAIQALASACDEVVVVTAPGDVPAVPGDPGVPLRIVTDDEPGAGPLAGLVTGLKVASGPVVLVVGGDMPGLVPDLLRELARRAGSPGVSAAALLVGDDLRPLPSAFRRDAALEGAAAVRAGGGSSVRALIRVLPVAAIDEAEWRAFDPTGSSLLDVDRPDDLERLRRAGGEPALG